MKQLFYIKNQYVLIMLVLLSLFSCRDGSTQARSEKPSSDDIARTEYAVEVSMEDELLVLKQKQLVTKMLTKKKDTLQFLLWAEDYPLKLNLNLNNTTILDQGSSNYTIPDINQPNVKVDLSFFNGNREVKPMNKRIIFRKGTISITKITKHKLQMTFEGEGSGVLENGKNFPISGKVEVTF